MRSASCADAYRERFGVELTCQVLTEAGAAIAPSTYYAANARRSSARALRNEWLRPEVQRVSNDNLGVYDVSKVEPQLHRERFRVPRC